MNSSPLPSTAMSPARRRNLALAKDAARLLDPLPNSPPSPPATSASGHAGAAARAGGVFDGGRAAARAWAGLQADVARDRDSAAAHVLPDPVEPIASALDAQPVGLAEPQSKRVADRHAMLRRLQFDPLDFGRRFAREQMRHQWGKIEPLVRPLPQGEHQRPHGNRSFKWK